MILVLFLTVCLAIQTGCLFSYDLSLFFSESTVLMLSVLLWFYLIGDQKQSGIYSVLLWAKHEVVMSMDNRIVLVDSN